jgi:hypothetical protein
MKKILCYIWQLPQNLLALLIIKITRADKLEDHKGISVYKPKKKFGMYAVSLGDYILVTEKPYKKILNHEYGHCIQSIYLGWLYLIVIGIPSATMNFLSDKNIIDSKRYYQRWPENWADKLGGVQR